MTKTATILTCGLIATLLTTRGRAAETHPEIILRANFDEANALTGWSGKHGALGPGLRKTSALAIAQTRIETHARLQRTVPADRLAGRLVTIAATVRAENVSTPPQPWNGIKVMLILETGQGRQYPQVPLAVGTFDWTRARHAVRVPKDITGATLVLGLEQVTGKVWFDDVEIRLGRPDRTGRRQAIPFRGHTRRRLRGVMHGPRFVEKDIRDLADWGANQIRWQLNWTPMKSAEEWARDLDRYDQWLDGALRECDRALDLCEELGFHVLVDLHTPPGGRAAGGVCRMFQEARYRDKLLAVWTRIAERYRGRRVIYAYDLINEPVEPPGGGITNWRDLATSVTRTIRAIDPDRPVVFEPGPWGGAQGFDLLTPLDVDRVIYSFHMYQPHAFTHQGVHTPSAGLTYPGVVNGIPWNRERLRNAMMPAIDFQRAFNVHIYVGEFSAIRWAPDRSAHRYLRDAISLFEEYGWDWSYHAYREWSGWSVEHTTDRKDQAPSPTPTERKKLLLEWFARNGEAG